MSVRASTPEAMIMAKKLYADMIAKRGGNFQVE
jgi:hypothetical protein